MLQKFKTKIKSNNQLFFGLVFSRNAICMCGKWAMLETGEAFVKFICLCPGFRVNSSCSEWWPVTKFLANRQGWKPCWPLLRPGLWENLLLSFFELFHPVCKGRTKAFYLNATFLTYWGFDTYVLKLIFRGEFLCSNNDSNIIFPLVMDENFPFWVSVESMVSYNLSVWKHWPKILYP